MNETNMFRQIREAYYEAVKAWAKDDLKRTISFLYTANVRTMILIDCLERKLKGKKSK